jgi:hypothetical protein
MGDCIKTTVAARQLNRPYWALFALIRDGLIDPPGKDSSGHYLWSPLDLEAARAALAQRRKKTVAAK